MTLHQYHHKYQLLTSRNAKDEKSFANSNIISYNIITWGVLSFPFLFLFLLFIFFLFLSLYYFLSFSFFSFFSLSFSFPFLSSKFTAHYGQRKMESGERSKSHGPGLKNKRRQHMAVFLTLGEWLR